MKSDPTPPGVSGRPTHSLPAPVFPAVLVVLLAIAVASTLVPTTEVEGLPADPSARAARDLLYGRVPLPPGELRFGSAFLGDPESARTPLADPALLAHARSLLERARAAHPLEPRVVAALAHLELASRRLVRAEALYRNAIDLRSHCTEARLGLGFTLAEQADGATDLFERRALRLRALAQFYAIGPRSERAGEALYDRALLEQRVGRHADAMASAREYLARGPSDPWAPRLIELLSPPRTPDAPRVRGGSGRSSAGSP